jgi:hypothetical protein
MFILVFFLILSFNIKFIDLEFFNFFFTVI